MLRGQPPHAPLPDPVALPARSTPRRARRPPQTPPNWSYAARRRRLDLGGAVYNGTRYPADYRGDIFVGDYVQGWVKRLDVDSSDRVTAVHDFASNWPTGVDIQAAPGDGDIAYVDLGFGGGPAGNQDDSDFTGATNAPPTAGAPPRPRRAPRPWPSPSTSAGSTDPDGDTLTYPWDFGDGTASSTAANPSHTYTSAGNYTATLTVTTARATPTRRR